MNGSDARNVAGQQAHARDHAGFPRRRQPLPASAIATPRPRRTARRDWPATHRPARHSGRRSPSTQTAGSMRRPSPAGDRPSASAISAATASRMPAAGRDGPAPPLRPHHDVTPLSHTAHQSPVVGCSTVGDRHQCPRRRQTIVRARRRCRRAAGKREASRMVIAFERIGAGFRDAVTQRRREAAGHHGPAMRREPPGDEPHRPPAAMPRLATCAVRNRVSIDKRACDTSHAVISSLTISLPWALEHGGVARIQRRIDRMQDRGQVERLIGDAVTGNRRRSRSPARPAARRPAVSTAGSRQRRRRHEIMPGGSSRRSAESPYIAGIGRSCSRRYTVNWPR